MQTVPGEDKIAPTVTEARPALIFHCVALIVFPDKRWQTHANADFEWQQGTIFAGRGQIYHVLIKASYAATFIMGYFLTQYVVVFA
jgi:hypothetical protein